jgi:hypothetical protein
LEALFTNGNSKVSPILFSLLHSQGLCNEQS